MPALVGGGRVEGGRLGGCGSRRCIGNFGAVCDRVKTSLTVFAVFSLQGDLAHSMARSARGCLPAREGHGTGYLSHHRGDARYRLHRPGSILIGRSLEVAHRPSPTPNCGRAASERFSRGAWNIRRRNAYPSRREVVGKDRCDRSSARQLPASLLAHHIIGVPVGPVVVVLADAFLMLAMGSRPRASARGREIGRGCECRLFRVDSSGQPRGDLLEQPAIAVGIMEGRERTVASVSGIEPGTRRRPNR